MVSELVSAVWAVSAHPVWSGPVVLAELAVSTCWRGPEPVPAPLQVDWVLDWVLDLETVWEVLWELSEFCVSVKMCWYIS